MKQLLRMAAFRRLVGGWTIGNVADSALFLTLAIWAKDLTGSSAAAGMVFFALGAPALAVPLLGLMVDRVRRKPLMVLANLAAAGAASCLVMVHGPGDMWLLYAVTAVYGALGILNGSALSGLLRDMLPDECLAPANAALTTIDQGLRILTPLLGAALYVWWGGRALGLGVAALLVVTAAVLATVRAQESLPERSTETSVWRETMAGFAHLRATPVVWRLTIVISVAFGVVGLFDTVLFEVIERGLGRPASFFAVLLTVQGAGAVVGGVTSARVLRLWGPAPVVGISLATLGGSALAATSDVFGGIALPAILIGMFAGGLVIPWLVVSLVTTRQRLTPARLQGRAAAATNLALTIPQIASTAVGAALVVVVDYHLLLLVAAAVLVGCGATLFAWPPKVSKEPPGSAATAPAASATTVP